MKRRTKTTEYKVIAIKEDKKPSSNHTPYISFEELIGSK